MCKGGYIYPLSLCLIVAACSLCCNATYTATIIDCFDTAIVCYKGTTDVKTFLSIRFKRMCTCSRNNTDEPVIGLDYRRWKKYIQYTVY